jgi:uncharacterized membrane protein
LKTRDALALVVILVSTTVLFTRIIQPTTLQLVVNGEVIESRSLPTVYTLSDVMIIAASSIALGACILYLMQPAASTVQVISNPSHWGETLSQLADPDEQSVYRIVMEEDGTIFQGELVERSGFSKSKVSLILDRLEAQHIVERKRYGMSNLVQLK